MGLVGDKIEKRLRRSQRALCDEADAHALVLERQADDLKAKANAIRERARAVVADEFFDEEASLRGKRAETVYDLTGSVTALLFAPADAHPHAHKESAP